MPLRGSKRNTATTGESGMYNNIDEWKCGCVDVWMSESIGVQVSTCWVSGCVDE